MKKLIFSVLLVLLAVISVQTASAQMRRHRGRAHVVRRNQITVVRVHPTVFRRAHIRYAALPRWGAVVNTYPPGAVMIRSGANPYYFYNGVYYAPEARGYVVARPYRGLRIRILPAGYRRLVVGTRPYFYYYGTFYSQVGHTKEYEVVEAPEGAIVDALPDGYEVKTIAGTEYYFLDGVYYAEVDEQDIEGGSGYKVVKV